MRPDWDVYFMAVASVVSTRSTCLRRRVGAVIVKENRILATGYNGAPSGLKHCLDTGCLREKQGIKSGERHELCRGLHAEQNALVQASVYGVSIGGATLYCTHQPCVLCAKMLVQAGIRRVVFGGDYPDKLAESILAEAGVILERFAREPWRVLHPSRTPEQTGVQRKTAPGGSGRTLRIRRRFAAADADRGRGRPGFPEGGENGDG